MDYCYFIAGFQTTDAEYLRQAVISIPGLLSTFVEIITSSTTVNNIDGFSILVSFSSPLTTQNQAMLDALVAGYTTSVPIAKAKKIAYLQLIAQNYVDTHYAFLTRTQLFNLYILAKFDNLPNRAAYIRPGVDWINGIIAYAANSIVTINSLTTLSDIQNYVIDVPGNAGTDPLLTLIGAISILS